MPSSAWITKPSLVANAIISRAATIVNEHTTYLSPYSTFQECWTTLEHIRVLVNNISPERRRKIQIAAERGACKYLTDLELLLDSLIDEYHSLYQLYEKFPFFQRRFLSTHLHNDILDFRDQVMEFFQDVWKTTAPGDRSIDWGAIGAQMVC